MPVEYAVDANVILRFVLGDDAQLSARAKAAFTAMAAGDIALVCDPVNLAEAVWVMSSYYGVPPREIADALIPLVKAPGFLLPGKDRYAAALEFYGQGQLRFGDACVCATALQTTGGRLLSFDRALSRVPGVVRTEAPAR